MEKRNALIGIIIGILGILVAIGIFVVDSCGDKSSEKSKLNVQVGTLDSEIQKLKGSRKVISSKIKEVQELIDENNKFIHDSTLYEKMDVHIGMVSDAVDQMGGDCDMDMNEEHAERWKMILREVGFSLNQPITDIMTELSDSSISISMLTVELLAQPYYACQFKNDMENWQNNSDQRASNFFEKLLYSLGIEHPRAGTELQQFLENQLRNYQEQSNLLEQQNFELTKEHKTSVSRLNNLETPFYCVFSNK